jgi:hypothetical protein
MGYRVSRQEYIRLKHIEKQFGAAAALETVRSGFVYGNIDTIVPTETNTITIIYFYFARIITNII